MKWYICAAVKDPGDEDIDVLEAMGRDPRTSPEVRDKVRSALLAECYDTEVVVYFDSDTVDLFGNYDTYTAACAQVRDMLHEVLPKCGYYLKNDVYFERDSTVAVRAAVLIDDVLIPAEDIKKIKDSISNAMNALGFTVTRLIVSDYI